MKVLVLNPAAVRELMTPAECIGTMERALADLARGEVFNPLRSIYRPPQSAGGIGLMPSYRGGESPAFGLKEVCVFPDNPKRGLDTHLGAVLLHSGDTGQLLAVISASAVTAVRTAAVTALATRILAREDSRTLAIIGAGAQARAHLEAMPHARPFDRIVIASSRMEEAERLAADNPRASARNTIEDAVREADVVVTVTRSRDPVLRREWIRPGTHVNLVGSSIRSAREADSATMAAGPIFVDRRESTVNESGDYLFALREGAIGESAIRAELGDVIVGKAPGRSSAEEITIFKSLGLAIEDLATAQFLFEKASRSGAGQWVEFE